MESMEEAINQLPLELRREVMDFVQFLLQKQAHKRGGKLSLDWVGGLEDYKDRFTSLELQKKALGWWGD